MNCQAGDLAVIVRSTSENEGRFVTVLRWIGNYTFLQGETLSDCWLVRLEQPMNTRMGFPYQAGLETAFPDSYLRPIRNEPGEDETLAWVRKPEGVSA